MRKKQRRQEQGGQDRRIPLTGVAIGLLGGRPSVGALVALVAIALVIGVSGGYLAFRLSAPSSPPVPMDDPAAPLRARLAQEPRDISALLALAHIHLDRQELDRAESLYRQVLALDAKNAEAITHMGNVLLARGQGEAALAKYEEALRVQPSYVHALWDKANFFQQVRHDYPEAIRAWEAFIQAVGPDSQDGRTGRAFIAQAREAMARK